MNEYQFTKLCNSCDLILKKTPSTISLPFLHVRREHPEELKIYQYLYANKLQKLIYLISKFIENIFKIILNLLISIKIQRLNSENYQKCDILFITHLISLKNINKNDDLYFNNLPKICEDMGYKVSMIYIDHTIDENNQLYKKNISEQFEIISKKLDFISEIRILNDVIKIGKKVICDILNNNSEKFLYIFTLINSISPQTIATLRIQYKFKEIYNKKKPKLVLLTWEGHAWERLIVSEIKKNEKCNSISIAYQFSILTRLQHSALRSLGNIYDPDYILTSGRVGFKRLINSKNKITNNVYVIGRDNSSLGKDKSNNKISKNTVLVIPEGIIEECKLFIKFCNACIEYSNEINFIIRLHPSLSFEKLKLNINNNQTKNITYSQSTLEKDIESCNYVLYRGSSAVIKALAMGLRPIYLSLDKELSIDPIFELRIGKLIVNNPAELINIVIKESQYNNWERELAIQYAKLYFYPQSIKKSQTIIKKILSNYE